MKWRKSLYDIIEVADEQNTLSKLYDWMMMIVIVVSIIPLAVRNANELTQMLDFVSVHIRLFRVFHPRCRPSPEPDYGLFRLR